MIEDKTPQRTSIAQLGEFALIDHLTKNFEINQASTLKGIGDDAAVLTLRIRKSLFLQIYWLKESILIWPTCL
jgi:thiamine-monophosphate kinase